MSELRLLLDNTPTARTCFPIVMVTFEEMWVETARAPIPFFPTVTIVYRCCVDGAFETDFYVIDNFVDLFDFT